MKRMVLRLGFASAALAFSLIAPVRATTVANCLRMLPYSATSIENCINICASHGCGFNSFDGHYCQCGGKY
jgi:hypothetical protein